MDDYKELIERLRGFEIDHSPDGWPAIRMREISAMCNAIESLLAENERLKHNLATTEQTMREYQELAAKRLEEIAKYRDAPVVAYIRKWAFDGEEPKKEKRENGRLAWPFKFKLIPVSQSMLLKDDIPLIVKPGEKK